MTEEKAEYICPEDKKPQFGTNWMDIILDERQQSEVRFSKIYIDKFNHGTDGHNPRILIATLARAIDLLASSAICCDVLEILVNGQPCSCPEDCSFSFNCNCPSCKRETKKRVG